MINMVFRDKNVAVVFFIDGGRMSAGGKHGLPPLALYLIELVCNSPLTMLPFFFRVDRLVMSMKLIRIQHLEGVCG